MPGFNQAGPFGQGSMTGRKMGRCTNYGAKQKNIKKDESAKQLEEHSEDYSEKESGFGMGRGFGFRQGGRGKKRQNRFRSVF